MDNKRRLINVTTTSKEEETMEAYIETYSGLRVYYDDLKPEVIKILDIAHSLSQICRFTGHTKKFYSVAQHSVIVANAQTTIAEKRAGLLHDATEAYVNDLPSPLKACTDLGDYKNLENRIHDVINKKYRVNDGMTENIKKADLQALFTEKRDVLSRDSDWGWGYNIEPFDEVIIPLPPEKAKKLFLETFVKLFPEEFVEELMDYTNNI
jgi:5'-deoxynucleotidase YfbR-like HD superfamily hydrolase